MLSEFILYIEFIWKCGNTAISCFFKFLVIIVIINDNSDDNKHGNDINNGITVVTVIFVMIDGQQIIPTLALFFSLCSYNDYCDSE